MTKYMLKPTFVDAVQIQSSTIIHTNAGDLVAVPGEWIINGKVIMSDATFKEIYVPLPTDPVPAPKTLTAQLIKETAVTITPEEISEVVLPKGSRKPKA